MTNLNTPFMIGNVEIPNRTVLAPMAGVTNSAFRTIAKELGAGLVVMEMVSDKGIQYNNEKTLHMLHIDEGENPVSIQLFGSDEDSLARAAEFIQENTKTDIVDINMGCPVNKIVKNEAGAMWLKDPEKIYKIINKVQSVLDIPLTVKMRTGWSDSSLAVENALAAEAAGVSALAPESNRQLQNKQAASNARYKGVLTMVDGDFSVAAGTWKDANGNTVTVSGNGQFTVQSADGKTDNYSIASYSYTLDDGKYNAQLSGQGNANLQITTGADGSVTSVVVTQP